MKFEIKSQGNLQKTLEEAQRALKEIEKGIGQVQFNAADPASVEKAIQDAKAQVDQKLSRYRSNPIVKKMGDMMKHQIEQRLRARAKNASSPSEPAPE
jgi:hypothetical protein